MEGLMSSVEATAKHVLGIVNERKQARARKLPPFRVVPESERAGPTVYYLCPDTNVPTGGVRVVYRHVDMLNSIGIPAAVVHHRSGFACTWFNHQTKVIPAAEIALSPADILVVPEFYGPSLLELPVGPRLIIFNQNMYRTFTGPGAAAAWRRYADIQGLEAILVVSRDNEEYARYAFPAARVARIRNSVDGQTFYPAVAAARRVGIMPRRRSADCQQVLELLEIRGCLDGWDVVRIDGMPEKEAAEALRSCSIFLSFSEQEGFGMPPAEAMACGCYVIGFTGLAGREFFDPDICAAIEEGDVLAFAKAIEQAIVDFDKDGQAMRRRGLIASERILESYSPQGQLTDLKSFYGALLAGRLAADRVSAANSRTSGQA
jgi:glycosyltransferase involved in cell wall biosynthesis